MVWDWSERRRANPPITAAAALTRTGVMWSGSALSAAVCRHGCGDADTCHSDGVTSERWKAESDSDEDLVHLQGVSAEERRN